MTALNSSEPQDPATTSVKVTSEGSAAGHELGRRELLLVATHGSSLAAGDEVEFHALDRTYEVKETTPSGSSDFRGFRASPRTNSGCSSVTTIDLDEQTEALNGYSARHLKRAKTADLTVGIDLGEQKEELDRLKRRHLNRVKTEGVALVWDTDAAQQKAIIAAIKAEKRSDIETSLEPGLGGKDIPKLCISAFIHVFYSFSFRMKPTTPAVVEHIENLPHGPQWPTQGKTQA